MERNPFSGSGNYPPGAKNDPKAPYNQPDRSHKHEWYPDEGGPVIEDGAAIFYQTCSYSEGRYREGWSCNEERSYRFEYDTLEDRDGNVHELPEIDNWEDVDSQVEKLVIKIESAFYNHGPGDEVSLGVDPDPDVGKVTLEYEGYTLTYSA